MAGKLLIDKRGSHVNLLQAKLSASDRALAVAKSGAEGATAQAKQLRQQLSAEAEAHRRPVHRPEACRQLPIARAAFHLHTAPYSS